MHNIIIVLIIQRDVYGVHQHRHWSTELGTTQGQGLGARLVFVGGCRGVHFFLGSIIIIIIIVTTTTQCRRRLVEAKVISVTIGPGRESDEIYANVLENIFIFSINRVPVGSRDYQPHLGENDAFFYLYVLISQYDGPIVG